MLRLSDQFNDNAGAPITAVGFLCWSVNNACSKLLSGWLPESRQPVKRGTLINLLL